jgi:hypothetical protein
VVTMANAAREDPRLTSYGGAPEEPCQGGPGLLGEGTLARRARPEERPPKGQVEVTFVGKLLGRKAK